MSKLYLGSIDLNKINKADIVTTDKNGNAFQNGAKYLNVTIWLNDEPDQYGNSIGIKSGDKENSYYVGNAKEYIKQGAANVSSEPVPNMYTKGADDGDGLPF